MALKVVHIQTRASKSFLAFKHAMTADYRSRHQLPFLVAAAALGLMSVRDRQHLEALEGLTCFDRYQGSHVALTRATPGGGSP